MSVKFFRLDKTRVDQALGRYVDRLAGNPVVLAVLLFGSLARGDGTGTSDADLVVILNDSAEPFHNRIPAFLFSGIGISTDIFPYTLVEAQQAVREGWGVMRVALREGRWLLDTANVRERLLAVQASGAPTRALQSKPL